MNHNFAEDKWIWSLEGSNSFTIKSLYTFFSKKFLPPNALCAATRRGVKGKYGRVWLYKRFNFSLGK